MSIKIVVDTNILFSAILNPIGKIGSIILNSKNHLQFYSCNFLQTELLKHRSKLLKLSKLSEDELNELEFLLTRSFIFINEALLPKEVLQLSEKILLDIDVNDTPFVALTKHLDAKLWTGDKELIIGLQSKPFIETLNTNQLSELLSNLKKN